MFSFLSLHIYSSEGNITVVLFFPIYISLLSVLICISLKRYSTRKTCCDLKRITEPAPSYWVDIRWKHHSVILWFSMDFQLNKTNYQRRKRLHPNSKERKSLQIIFPRRTLPCEILQLSVLHSYVTYYNMETIRIQFTKKNKRNTQTCSIEKKKFDLNPLGKRNEKTTACRMENQD